MGRNDVIIFQFIYIYIYIYKLSLKCKHFWRSAITFNRVHPQISPLSPNNLLLHKGISLHGLLNSLKSFPSPTNHPHVPQGIYRGIIKHPFFFPAHWNRNGLQFPSCKQWHLLGNLEAQLRPGCIVVSLDSGNFLIGF